MGQMILQKTDSMIKELAWDMIGGIGCLMAIVFPSLEQIEQLARILGISLGIVLAIVSIIHKLLEIKKLKYGSKSETASKKNRGIDSEDSRDC